MEAGWAGHGPGATGIPLQVVAGVVRTYSHGRRIVMDSGPRVALAWVELGELIRAAETTALGALGLLRGVEPGIPATSSVTLSAEETEQILDACEAIDQLTDVLVPLASTLRAEDVEIRRRDLRHEASGALAAGVADVRRVLLLAQCLALGEGFRALAEALRCTSCHETWREATVGDVLSCFQGADGRVVRRITEEARLAPESRWDVCARVQISRLADALERFAIKVPSR